MGGLRDAGNFKHVAAARQDLRQRGDRAGAVPRSGRNMRGQLCRQEGQIPGTNWRDAAENLGALVTGTGFACITGSLASHAKRTMLMLTCPNDSTALVSVQIENVTLDQCPTCGGYWLQRGELETLGERHDAHLDPITVGRVGTIDSKRKCPLDGTQLVQHEFVEHTGIKMPV